MIAALLLALMALAVVIRADGADALAALPIVVLAGWLLLGRGERWLARRPRERS